MPTTLLGYFKYNQRDTGKPMVILWILTNKIDSARGDGYNVKQFFVNSSIIPDNLRAGKVQVKLNEWNPNILEEIKNI